MYINRATLYGNLTRDPELKALPSGVPVVNFSIATNRTYKDKDGKKAEQTDYHNIVGFGKQAELIGQYLKKGSGIYVEGRLQTQNWEKDGQKHYRTEVVIESFQFGPKSAGSAKSSESEASETTNETTEDINPDDIPF